MFKTLSEAADLAEGIKSSDTLTGWVEVVVCPPFTALDRVAAVLRGTGIAVGAQDVYWEESGAFTGEISPVMLKDIGCRYVIAGHSERRQLFGETDEKVSHKVKAIIKHGMVPILCVGETLAEREAGRTGQVIHTQVQKGLSGLTPDQAGSLVIAYEPVWAIGTGKTASDGDAQEVISSIRSLVKEWYGDSAAAQVRIQYGGSVKPGNTAGLMAQPDIDGALVGGASLEAASFIGIVQAAQDKS